MLETSVVGMGEELEYEILLDTFAKVVPTVKFPLGERLLALDTVLGNVVFPRPVVDVSG